MCSGGICSGGLIIFISGSHDDYPRAPPPQMLIKAGTEGKQIVFLFSDNQIKDESFVEDINMILNTGDVPNIFPSDEKAEIIEKMQMIARTEVHVHDVV